jgi:predicted DNA binding CopG/RHH family protein
MAALLGKAPAMRKNYDFSKGKKNPHAAAKQQVTIRLDCQSVAYFKDMAKDVGLPYQTLINLYLRDCASAGRVLNLRWKK